MKSIYFMHPWVKSVDDIEDYLCISGQHILDGFIWDKDKPDYIIVTEQIFSNKKSFAQFRRYYKRLSNSIFVFHGGEAVSPDLNIFDYAIVHDYALSEGDRIIRIPPCVFYHESMIDKENTYSREEACIDVKKRKFCNFIYSNPNSHPMRDTLFYEIDNYKHVDSLGRHLNNAEIDTDRNSTAWREGSVITKSKYKFSIAAENACHVGYTSEKLLTSFQAHTVPIYWGNPLVKEEFNSKAFIDCNELGSIESVIKRIEEIDTDDRLWVEMVTQPWQTKEQLYKQSQQTEQYNAFLKHIFEQNINNAMRRPIGTFNSIYRKWFFRRIYNMPSFIRRIVPKIKRKYL